MRNGRGTLAAHGGTAVRTDPFPRWPPVPTEAQRAAVEAVLESGAWGSTHGTRTAHFADRFARHHDARFGVAVANGTVGLFAALRAVGVRRGDEVIVPTFTFVATATAVLMAGAEPVFADIDPETMLVTAESVSQRVTPRTAAVIPVHLAGAVADVDAIRAALPTRVRIVEDAAQSPGAAHLGRCVGSLGDIASFSFQSSKNMTAGEGGLLVTSSEDVYRQAWAATNVGRLPGGAWYEHPHVGWNLRMTELQSALLDDQLDRLDELNQQRDRGARELAAMLDEADLGVRLLLGPESTTTHARHLALLRFDPTRFAGATKAEVSDLLQAEGIPASPGYPLLSADAAIAAESSGNVTFACPVAEEMAPRTMWLPQSVLLAESTDLADVVEAIAKVASALQDPSGLAVRA